MSAPNPFVSIVAALGLDVTVEGAANELDAEWFAAHPTRRLILRPMIPGEFGDEVTQRLEEPERHMVLVISNEVRVLVRPVLVATGGDDS